MGLPWIVSIFAPVLSSLCLRDLTVRPNEQAMPACLWLAGVARPLQERGHIGPELLPRFAFGLQWCRHKMSFAPARMNRG